MESALTQYSQLLAPSERATPAVPTTATGFISRLKLWRQPNFRQSLKMRQSSSLQSLQTFCALSERLARFRHIESTMMNSLSQPTLPSHSSLPPMHRTQLRPPQTRANSPSKLRRPMSTSSVHSAGHAEGSTTLDTNRLVRSRVTYRGCLHFSHAGVSRPRCKQSFIRAETRVRQDQ